MTYKLLKIKFCLSLLTVLFSSFSFAQDFSASGKVSAIKKTGLYFIPIPADLRSKSKDNLNELRIYDSKNKEVPYFLDQNQEFITSEVFNEIPINSKGGVANKNSFVVIENTTKQNISSLVLEISNTDLTKIYSVSGSNDLNTWFGLVNNQILDDLNDAQQTFVRKSINFPINFYKYIKIDFNDVKSLPLNILKAGSFLSKVSENKLEEIKTTRFTIKDDIKNKITRVNYNFKDSQIINQIAFSIHKPQFYKRSAKLIVNRNRKNKRVTETYRDIVYEFELSSDRPNIFNLNEFKERDFYIEINNDDNPALSIAQIQLYQIPVRIIANLDSAENYMVKVGAKDLFAPQYDLAYFKSKILGNLMPASIYDIQAIKEPEQLSAKKSIWQEPWVMWVCIALVGLGVGYISLNMINDMNKNKEF